MRFLLSCSLVALLAGGALAEVPARDFAEHGFRWALPSADWEFLEVSSADVRSGWVARVKCGVASIEAFAFVGPHDGLSLQERVQEIAQHGADGLGEVAAVATHASTLSGVPGTVVVQRVDGESGAEGHFRTYAIVAGPNFYHLIVRAWSGAHTEQRDAINALRKGFRLLKGAGGEDAEESFDEELGASAARAPKAEVKEGAGFPEGGPVVRDSTVCLPSHNFEWTLPADSPLQWKGGTKNEKAESGQFLILAGAVERKKQEFEQNTPDHNHCLLSLFIFPAPPGMRVDRYIRNQGGNPTPEDFVQKELHWLDEIKTTKTRTGDDVNFGNWKASYAKFEGDYKGQPAAAIVFAAMLKGKLYLLCGQMVGHTDAYQQFAPIIGEALKGIRFPDTKEWIAGPLLGAVPEFTAKRGESADAEKEYIGPGFTFLKPEGMARLQIKDSMNQDLRHACEGRSEDGEKYVYFEIRSWKLNIANTPNKRPEEVVTPRIQEWEANAGEGNETGKNAKGIAWKNGNFNGAKGITYEFKGFLEGKPFTEEGWVVQHKSNLYSIRLQLGGEGAENDMKDMVKKLKKGLKWAK